VFVYDPKRKVIASGDALQGWVPTMGDASIYDWIQQLTAVERLDFKYVIGGHGEVLQGKDTLVLWRNYFTDLLSETATAAAQGASLEETKGRIMPALQEKYGTHFPRDFSRTIVANVETAYREITTQTK
jgi:glyoxylase-like metal-dependent hydrolase (beta-lactamase superfamily II)